MGTQLTQDDFSQLKAIGFLHNKGTRNFSARIITRNGKITATQQIAIGEAAQKFGNGNVTFTARMTIEVQGIAYEQIDAFRTSLLEYDLKTGGTGAKVRPVVSCKGTTCQYGLIDTFALSERIHDRFFEGYFGVSLPHKFKIGVGGCPNSCIKPALNDVGIEGQCIPIMDESLCKNCKKCQAELVCPVHALSRTQGIIARDVKACIHCGLCIRSCPFHVMDEGLVRYKVYVGGRWGKQISIAKPLSALLKTEDEVLTIIEKIILFYKLKGKKGQRLSQVIEQVGFQKMEAMLFNTELLDKKEQILNP